LGDAAPERAVGPGLCGAGFFGVSGAGLRGAGLFVEDLAWACFALGAGLTRGAGLASLGLLASGVREVLRWVFFVGICEILIVRGAGRSWRADCLSGAASEEK